MYVIAEVMKSIGLLHELNLLESQRQIYLQYKWIEPVGFNQSNINNNLISDNLINHNKLLLTT